MSQPIKVEIEYCGGWGYGQRYRELSNAILASLPEALVSGFVGRRSSFEVKLNGQEIHSKLETKGFPDFKEVVQICNDTNKGSSPTSVQKVHSTTCNIL